MSECYVCEISCRFVSQTAYSLGYLNSKVLLNDLFEDKTGTHVYRIRVVQWGIRRAVVIVIIDYILNYLYTDWKRYILNMLCRIGCVRIVAGLEYKLYGHNILCAF